MDRILVQNGDKDIRESLRRALRASPKSRPTIAEELSARIGRAVSVESLNKWASEDESARRLPADCLLPISEILEDDSLQRLVLSEHMARCLHLGEWLLGSKWVIEQLDVKLPGEASQGEERKVHKLGRPAAQTANRP